MRKALNNWLIDRAISRLQKELSHSIQDEIERDIDIRINLFNSGTVINLSDLRKNLLLEAKSLLCGKFSHKKSNKSQ